MPAALHSLLDRPPRFSDPVTDTHLWLIDTDAHAAAVGAAEDLLSADERLRAAGLRHAPRRAGYILARAVLRNWLSARDRKHRQPRDWVLDTATRGKPRLPSDAPARDFSVSYSGELAALAISTGARIGVDLEAHREEDFSGVSRRFLHPDECAALPAASAPDHAARFLRYWTIKEAVSKSMGLGFGLPFTAMAARLDPPALVAWPPEHAALAQTRLLTETVITLSGPYYLALAITPEA
ncbi:MAG: 4'-phosphopantetheinyl transferase superfamily protein [Hyphomicrobiaceae bacterium]|nr:4'-phosphopantetheinyl transferase superfamily protein [Hyphomicrobiaceae bacterium]